MIGCPICGAKTTVAETRAMAAGIRRRRRCSKYTCAGRVTTIEAVTRVTRGAAIGHIVQVPRRQLEQLRRLVTAIGGGDP